ncbi:MAG: hypothetical protein Q9212_002037 [Teloschistes hypoglaucus]
MAQFAKNTFSCCNYAAFRPIYSDLFYQTVLEYHHGSQSLCVDLGTGHGLIARALASSFSEVKGIDPSAGMIQQARWSTSKEQYPNIEFHHASAESIPFLHDASTDLVIAGQAAHWFDYPKLFPELKRILRAKGTIAFVGYSDPVFIQCPKATEVLKQHAYGDSLGCYWSQPGRQIVQGKLRDIEPPMSDWGDIRRDEYEPDVEGPRRGPGTMLLDKTMKIKECMSYIRTWSAVHAWQEAHADRLSLEKGGPGDVVDWMFDEMREAEPAWQISEWKEKNIVASSIANPMPPFIAGKRQRSSSPLSEINETPKSAKKRTLFDVADERPSGTLKANQEFLQGLEDTGSDTSLSDVSSVEFEDVTPQNASKRRKLEHHDEEDEEEIDWEDAVQQGQANWTPSEAVQPSGDLELTLDKGAEPHSFTNDQKKGPSKIERQIRIVTHCMHVQFLLLHNSTRSRFACDSQVQHILVDQLPPQVKKEVETWKLASGIPQDVPNVLPKHSGNPRGRKGKSRKSDDVRSQRDWGNPAERQEKGAPNMSRGDPIIRLLKVLAAYWKKRFTITKPGLRKQGYKPLHMLESELASFKNDKHDPEEHGEHIANLSDFRDLAKKCEGSRDVGVQLFVALLRGLGLEARLVASLQPVGFGWNKNEEAAPKKKRSAKGRKADISEVVDLESASEDPKSRSNQKSKPNKRTSAASGSKATAVDLLSSSGSGLSSPGTDDDESIIDITPSAPRKNMPYDLDIVFPTYWTEVISPITHEVYPADPFILTPGVATNPEHLAAFESRGAKVDKAKQVFAYVIAYSPDGTAKDVTTRYLKKHMWPGRTKGVRLPVEKIPIYNKRGKIKHHVEYDWFKTVMSGYTRPDHMRTAVDDIEESKDLKPVKPEKKSDAKVNKEGTLQFYKTSAEYVLERHLRREEALPPDAEPVKYFTAGKGDDAKEEPVFLRKDVLICRTSESWHKEGRQILPGMTAMKMVPIRAVTLTRKREVEEAQRDGGEKLKQGLYSWEQTEWIIPPPITDGIIPKNAYGNMDCFVPTMVPEGAAHVPLRSTAKICKRLGIDFAEAVTGFEFGKQRAVPVITGVVVAEENRDVVMREWEKDEEERKIKEEGKREKVALGMWKKLLVGLRIVERVRDEYGADGGTVKEEVNPFTNRKKHEGVRKDGPIPEQKKDDMAGGFMADDADGSDAGGGGFLPEGDMPDSDTGGGFLPNGHEELEIEHSNPRKSNPLLLQPQQDTSNSEVDSGSDADSDSPPPSAKKTPRAQTNKKVKSTPKSQPKPKPSRKPAAKRKANGAVGSAVAAAGGESEATPKRASRAKRTAGLTDSTPKRRAVPRRKAAQVVKSPYFEHGSSEGEDDDDEEEEDLVT